MVPIVRIRPVTRPSWAGWATSLEQPTKKLQPRRAHDLLPEASGRAYAPAQRDRDDGLTDEELASLQQQVLAWLASIQQDPQFASLSTDQQQQLQAPPQAVTALDPADPAFSDSLQTLLQSYGLAE